MELDKTTLENTLQNSKVDYPLVSDTGKRYRYIELGLREYESGTLYRERNGDQKGHLVSGPERAIITVDNAKEMQAKGIEARRKRALKGYRRAIENNRHVTVRSGQEYEYWGQTLGEIAHTTDIHGIPTSAQVRANEIIGDQVLDMKPREQQPGNQQPGTFQLTVTGSIQQLQEAMRRKYQQVIDVEPSEPDSG